MRNDLRRLHARLDALEKIHTPPAPVLTSAECRQHMRDLERKMVEPGWIAKFGRPPTDEEVDAHRPTILRELAAQAEKAGRHDWAADFQRFADAEENPPPSWRELLARDLEAEDPARAARLRAADAAERSGEVGRTNPASNGEE